MKKNQVFAAIVFLLVFCAGCWYRNGHGLEITSYNDSQGKKVTSITSRDNHVLEEIKYSGDFKLNEEETGIVEMSANAFLAYRKNGQQIAAVSDAQGHITYQLNDGDKTTRPSDEGSMLLSQAIREMIMYGFDAEKRMQRVYSKGGIPALLHEIENLNRDDIRKNYFEFMLSKDSLSSQDQRAIALKIGSSLGSDNDKENLLGRFGAERLKDSITNNAWLEAVDRMGSDFSKQNLLTQRINYGMIPPNRINDLLPVIDRLGSDNAKENLLLQIIRQDTLPSECYDKFLETANRMGSDNAKENVLSHLINKASIPGQSADTFLETIDHLGSDNSKENLIGQLIEKKRIPRDHYDQALSLISRMGSDNGKSNLYHKLTEDATLTEEQWISLIGSTEHLGSDHDKAELLTTIAKKMPPSEKIKSAYLKTAKAILGDADYGRAVKAIE